MYDMDLIHDVTINYSLSRAFVMDCLIFGRTNFIRNVCIEFARIHAICHQLNVSSVFSSKCRMWSIRFNITYCSF